jgi:hypothetical protein
MAEIDYSAQEILIMAALSGDQAMIDDYMAGDPAEKGGCDARIGRRSGDCCARAA